MQGLVTLQGQQIAKLSLISVSTDLEGRARELASLRQTAWTKHQGIPSFGYSSGVVWARLDLKNDGNRPTTAIIVSKSPWVDTHHLFAFDYRGRLVARMQVGDRLAAGPGVWQAPHPTFPLDLDANSGLRVLIRYESRGSIVVPIEVTTPAEARASMADDYFLQSALFAILLLVGLFGVGVFALTRDPGPGYFGVQMLSNGYALLVLSGLAQDSALQGQWYALNEGLMFAGALSAAASLGFVRAFLHLDQNMPRTNRFIQILQWSLTLLAVIGLIPAAYHSVSKTLNYAVAFVFLLPIAAGLLLSIKRISGALTLAFGASLSVAGIMIESFSTGGFLPQSYLGLMGIRLGMVSQGIWFGVALGLRMRYVSAQKMRAQAKLEAIDMELAQAEKIHKRLLPRDIAQIDGATLWARHEPASRIGGDLYAVERLGPNNAIIFLADVAGHGLPAALDCSLVRVALYNALNLSQRPAEILQAMNLFLCANMEARFASAICAQLDTSSGKIVLAVAGHPAALLVDPVQTKPISGEGPLLGLQPDWVFEQTETALPTDGVVALYTDGLLKTAQKQHNAGTDELLNALAYASRERRGAELGEFVFERVLDGGGTDSLADDATLILADLRP